MTLLAPLHNGITARGEAKPSSGGSQALLSGSRWRWRHVQTSPEPLRVATAGLEPRRIGTAAACPAPRPSAPSEALIPALTRAGGEGQHHRKHPFSIKPLKYGGVYLLDSQGGKTVFGVMFWQGSPNIACNDYSIVKDH